MASDDDRKVDDILEEAREAFKLAQDAEADNRQEFIDDVKFARLSEQWPDEIQKQREEEGRPCLTLNRMNSFIRQVVNDARQNKPSIRVHPVDSGADPETANILNGLIRNIEYTSNADVAYDTAIEHSVSGGFGYWRIDLDYAHDDTFDLDIGISRVANPLSVYGDPHSTAADSSDWNSGFIVESMKRAEFEARFKGADARDWDSLDYAQMEAPWMEDEAVLVAEWFKREEVPTKIYRVRNVATGETNVLGEKRMRNPDVMELLAMGFLEVTGERDTTTHKVKRYLMTGAEVLEEDDWAGRYIPIVPVYGDEVNLEGKRYFRSLIRDAKDPQRMFNYWRPLALDTLIPTPGGWTTMGAIAVGDELFDERGQPCKVVGKSPVHIKRDCFKVTFDDGSHIVADADHPWHVEERGKRTSRGFEWNEREITTAKLTPRAHFIPVAKPLQCSDADLPIDPYLLGHWLGDGDSAAARLTPGDDDLDEVRGLLFEIGCDLGPSSTSEARHKTFNVRGLHASLVSLGLLRNKHIPAAYLRASESQRWSLLQGLMDSDGSISRANRQCSFTTVTPAIAAGFAELVRSLGFKAAVCKRAGRYSAVVNGPGVLQDVYQFSFTCYADEPVFRLARKRALQGNDTEHRRRTKRHRIISVEPVASVPVQCVAIDAPSHLFLAGEAMVPTHNTAATELVALAPRVPYIGPKGAFKTDAGKWATANTVSHSFIEYDGQQPPQRQPLDGGTAAGALQEALNASDDMKSIMGIYDASLGARSNETSGRAILARQREGDVSTFHFIDNLNRAIRHTGRIIVDIIPHVYTNERIIRVLGENGTATNVPLGRETPAIDPNTGEPQRDPETGQPKVKIYDLTAGKYDVTVKTGPSYTTQREETVAQMTELIRAYPPAAPVLGDILVEMMDLPNAPEIAKRLKSLLPQGVSDGIPPQIAEMIEQGKQAISQAGERIRQLEQENAALKADKSVDAMEAQMKGEETRIRAYDAETKRMKVVTDAEAAAVAAARAEMERVNRPQMQQPMPQPAPAGPQGY